MGLRLTCTPCDLLASNFSLQYHPWVKHLGSQEQKRWSWFLNKLPWSTPLEMQKEQEGEYAYWYWRDRGLSKRMCHTKYCFECVTLVSKCSIIDTDCFINFNTNRIQFNAVLLRKHGLKSILTEFKQNFSFHGLCLTLLPREWPGSNFSWQCHPWVKH